MSRSAGSTIARASSGSRSCSSSVEPLISANSAVTVLRSPSRFSELGESATRIGESFDFFDDAGAANGAPQSSQNFAVGALSAPHFAQRLANGVPHSAQNFLPEVLSVPHFEQRIDNRTFWMAEYRRCPHQLTERDSLHHLSSAIEAFVLIMLTEVFDPAGATLHSMSGCKLAGRARGERL